MFDIHLLQVDNIHEYIDYENLEDDSVLHSGDDEVEDENYDDTYPDLSYLFPVTIRWQSKSEGVEWTKNTGKVNNMALVIARSDAKSVWLSCELHGKPRVTKVQDMPLKEVKRRDNASRKCGCLFSIKCFEAVLNVWAIKVIHGSHNHPLAKYMEGNRHCARLTPAEYNRVKELAESHMKPAQIMEQLKKEYPGNLSILKTIHNAKQKAKKEGRKGRTVVQHFLHKAHEHKYFHRHRTFDDGVASELFFAHPESINLLRSFPYVLIMDATYNTNG